MWEVIGVDNRSGPPIITSEVTPRSHNTDPEYCLQSKEWHPVQKNPPQRALAFVWGPPCSTPPPPQAPPCLRGPYLWHAVPLVHKLETTLILTLNINHDSIRWFTALSKRRQTRQQQKYDSILIIYTGMYVYMTFYSKSPEGNIILMSTYLSTS